MGNAITFLGMTCTKCQVGLPFRLELLYVSDLLVQGLCDCELSLQNGRINIFLNCCNFFFSYHSFSGDTW
jgi:hypothetical protein